MKTVRAKDAPQLGLSRTTLYRRALKGEYERIGRTKPALPVIQPGGGGPT